MSLSLKEIYCGLIGYPIFVYVRLVGFTLSGKGVLTIVPVHNDNGWHLPLDCDVMIIMGLITYGKNGFTIFHGQSR